MQQQQRHLAAILFTDIVGSTAMMQKNETEAVAMLKHYTVVLKKSVTEHGGAILNDYGDGTLCTFPSATAALHCAIELQQQLRSHPVVPLRIGVHLGEIFFEEEKVMGDSVNVASRIQSLGQANTVLFSKEIHDKIRNQPYFKCVSLGSFEFKNVDEPMEVFALANERLLVPKREEMSGKLKEIVTKSGRKKWFIAAAVLLLFLSTFLIYKGLRSNTGFTGEKSIAVLPFENTGAKDSEEYLSDGITQDIISSLAKVSSLEKVIAWFSVKNFKKTTNSVQEIAAKLGVSVILTGTIQRQSGKIQVNAELIDVNTNKRLWGNEYKYDSKDVLSIQTDVVQQIVNALSANLNQEEKRQMHKNYTENVEAYKLYRKGRAFWDQRSKASYDSAEIYYKKAIDLDPDYALAYSGLADCYTFNQKGLSQPEAIPIARTYATKALSLDSTLVEARTTIAFIQSHYDYDWEGAAVLFRKIISDNPNYPTAHLYYGNVLLYRGNFNEGLNETKKALSLDPLSAVINYVLGRNYFFSGQYDSAIIQLQKNLNLNPNFKNSYVPLGQAYVQKQLYSKAADAFSMLPQGPFDQGLNGRVFLSCAFAFAGDYTKAKALFANVSEQERLQSPYYTSYVYMALRDYDAALTILEHAYQVHTIAIPFLKIDPFFDPIRNESRYRALMRKMHLD